MNTPSSTDSRTGAPPVTRAAVIDGFGGPETLHATVIPLTAPSASQVQLQVVATAVNPVDLQTRAGLPSQLRTRDSP